MLCLINSQLASADIIKHGLKVIHNRVQHENTIVILIFTIFFWLRELKRGLLRLEKNSYFLCKNRIKIDLFLLHTL